MKEVRDATARILDNTTLGTQRPVARSAGSAPSPSGPRPGAPAPGRNRWPLVYQVCRLWRFHDRRSSYLLLRPCICPAGVPAGVRVDQRRCSSRKAFMRLVRQPA